MLPARFSISTAPLGLPLKASLDHAAKSGAQGVQVDLRQEISPRDYGETARRQLLHTLKERGLQLASASFPLRSPLTARDHLDERLAAVREAIEFAGLLKVRLLTLRAGRIPAEDQREERELLISLLSELAQAGNRHGVVLALLPAGDDPADLKALLEAVKTGPVQVVADPAAWLMHGQKPAAQLRDLHAVIGLFEVRDAVRDVDGSGREVPVGRGELDWDELAALIGEIGYTGWLNVTRTAGEDRAGDVSRAVRYLKNVFVS